MPQTPVYGLPFEQASDQPGITLTGGSVGTEDILAEAVETELIRIEGDVGDNTSAVAAIEARLDLLEAGTTMVGWTPIQSGQNTGASFDIDLTDGGRFLIGEFALVRLEMRYDLDVAGGYVGARINNDTGPYLYGTLVYNAAGTLAEDEFSSTADEWLIGYGGTVSTNNLIGTFFHMDSNTLHSYQSTSARQSSSLGSHRYAEHWGAIQTTLGATPSTIRILAISPATSFVNAWWWATGYRVP